VIGRPTLARATTYVPATKSPTRRCGVRGECDDQTDEEAETVDEQEDPPKERASESARLALRVHDALDRRSVCRRGADDALEHDEIDEAGRERHQPSGSDPVAVPGVEGVSELHALTGEAAGVTQGLARVVGSILEELVFGQRQHRDITPRVRRPSSA